MSKSLRMPITRLTEDQMREIVLDRLACKVMFSGEIPAATRSLCLLPVAMGALSPPAEIMVALLGSDKPPETLEGDPEKPKHPGYPPELDEPPEKPVLGTISPALINDLEWGEATEDEVACAKDDLQTENRRRIREWQDASFAWQDALDERTQACGALDAAYEETMTAWRDSLPAHEDAKAARQKAHDDWVEKHDRIFADWGANIGEIMGHMKDSFPRGINGCPMFHAVTVIHKDDWSRIEAAIIREQSRPVQV
jgi:hypothetical protein